MALTKAEQAVVNAAVALIREAYPNGRPTLDGVSWRRLDDLHNAVEGMEMENER